MLTRKIPFYYLLLTLLLAGGTTFYLVHKNSSMATANAGGDKEAATSTADNTEQSNCKIASQKGFELIKPLLWAKPAGESKEYATLKASLMNMVEDNKTTGVLSSASVYFMNLTDGDWTYVNPAETFHPASLVKVPLLITYLRMAEANPELLNKKIPFTQKVNVPTQNFTSAAIQEGHTYTIKELLHYMIAYSDNNATNLLNQNIDKNEFKKTFSDLKMPEPDLRDPNFTITAKHYSRFILVLYNASYLSKSSSEYAMELLTECDFKQGMTRELPGTVKVAHKFGEWGDNIRNLHELHESGIVYLNNKPFLLTIMTRGKGAKSLSDVISRMSKAVYDAAASKDAAVAVTNSPNA